MTDIRHGTPRPRSHAAVAIAAVIVLVGLSMPSPADGRALRAPAVAGTPRGTFSWVPPTLDQPAINRANAGTRVGVHFRIGGDQGLDILEPGWPRAERVDCQTGQPIEGTRWRTHPYGAAGLEYDDESGTYSYVWEIRPEWGRPPLHCRQFLLRLRQGGPVPHALTFRFAPGSLEAPPGLDCADIRAGDGAYVSKDANDDPLPDPKVVFLLRTAAPSCAPASGDVTRYRLFALPAEAESGGTPSSWLRIASQARLGDGSTDTLVFDFAIREDPAPEAVCLYAQVMRAGAMVERAPDRGCKPYELDAGPPGFSGWD